MLYQATDHPICEISLLEYMYQGISQPSTLIN